MKTDPIWKGLGFRMEVPPVPADAPPPVAEPAAPTPGDGPWAAALAENFTDPDQRAAVDQFLRETVQPHVTRVEQSRTPEAEELYNALNENPAEAFMAITTELWGEDAAETVRQALTAQSEPTPEPTPAAQPATPPEPVAGLDPKRVEAVVTSFEKAEQAKAYKQAVDDFQTNLPEDEQKDFKEARFSPFLVAADGDWDAAYEGYKQWVADFKSEYGAPPAAGDEPAPDTPPAVLGSDTVPGTAPPVQKNYGGDMDAAIDRLPRRAAPR
jgi:hypothetical protein